MTIWNFGVNSRKLFIGSTVNNLEGHGIKRVANVSSNSLGIGCLLRASTSGSYIEADNASNKPCDAIAVELGTGQKTVLLKGFIRNDLWSWSSGDLLYLGPNGTITNVVPTSGTVQTIGIAKSSSVIKFDPDKSYISTVFNSIPTGLIIPYNDTTLPDGWIRFDLADNRMIIGAGSTYNPGDTGGSNSITINESLGAGGNHGWEGSLTFPFGSGHDTPGSSRLSGDQNQNSTVYVGDHTHTITGGSFSPQCNDLILIKSISTASEFPQNSLVLANTPIGTLTNVFTNNFYLKSTATLGTSGQSYAEMLVSAAGTHIHWRYGSGGPNTQIYENYVNEYSGLHSTNINATITDNIKKARLSAWTNASQSFALESNIIGMYESITPPTGWVLCDGTNGTPDLRDYFIQTTSNGGELPGAGDNTIDINCSSVSHTSTHTHKGVREDGYVEYPTVHTTYSNTHNHSGGTYNKAFLPPYYALAFIMKS